MPTYVTIIQHPTNSNMIRVQLNDLEYSPNVMYGTFDIVKSALTRKAKGLKKTVNSEGIATGVSTYFIELNFMDGNIDSKYQLCAIDGNYNPNNGFYPVTSVFGTSVTTNDQLFDLLDSLFV